MKAVGNIERITKTMQLIASARFQAMQKKATQSKAYTTQLGDMVGELSTALAGDGDISHPLMSAPEIKTGRERVLVLTAERGLCGAYNGNVMRKAMGYVQNDLKLDNANLDVAGKKGQSFCKFNRINVDNALNYGDSAAYADVEQLAQRYIDEFMAAKVEAVKVIYMKFETMSRQTPTVQTLLPLESEASDKPDTAASTKISDPSSGPASVYEFSPEPEALLDTLLPTTVKTTLFQCFNDASVSEQLARMIAMKSATDAAGKQKKDLKRQFNRARQTAITTELSEIIAGAAALE